MPSVAMRKPCRRKPSNNPLACPWLRVGNAVLLGLVELPDGVDVLVVVGVALLLPVAVGAGSSAPDAGADRTVVADCASAVAVSAAHSISAASTESVGVWAAENLMDCRPSQSRATSSRGTARRL